MKVVNWQNWRRNQILLAMALDARIIYDTVVEVQLVQTCKGTSSREIMSCNVLKSNRVINESYFRPGVGQILVNEMVADFYQIIANTFFSQFL